MKLQDTLQELQKYVAEELVFLQHILETTLPAAKENCTDGTDSEISGHILSTSNQSERQNFSLKIKILHSAASSISAECRGDKSTIEKWLTILEEQNVCTEKAYSIVGSTFFSAGTFSSMCRESYTDEGFKDAQMLWNNKIKDGETALQTAKGAYEKMRDSLQSILDLYEKAA